MTNNRHKKLEKKRKKREEKRFKVKNSSPGIREQHVGKSMDEKIEYIKFIEGNGAIQRTNRATEEEDDLKKIEIIGEEKESKTDKTSSPVSSLKQSSEDSEALGKKKISGFSHFKNRWKRKWADKLVDSIFNFIFFIITTILSLVIGYYFARSTFQKDLEKFKKDIADPKSEIRGAIKSEILTETNSQIRQAIENNSKCQIINTSTLEVLK